MPRKKNSAKTAKKTAKKRGRKPNNQVKTKKLPDKSFKVLMVATEVAPYVTIGGESQVVSYLSKAHVELGQEVAVFLPKFGFLDEEKYKIKMLHKGLKVPTDDETTPFLICNVKTAIHPENPKVKIYFLENQEYYEKRANVYNYSDDHTRFALLARGALEFIKTGTFVPDIVHCHDWHTGLVPNYLKTVYKKDAVLSKISCVFTIHNLAYQTSGFDPKYVSELEYDDGKSDVASLFSERLNTQNFLKRGLIYADAVNTVSKTYSREILTPDFGAGLDKLLLELKGKLFGIVNGIDYGEFDPATDKLIETNFDLKSLKLRIENKRALQKEFDLTIDENLFLLGSVGRLDQQKGVDLMITVLRHLLNNFNIQFVQVGGGDGWLSEQLQQLQQDFPDKVGVHPYTNFTLPRSIFAGSDALLQPSRFEPCGITQIEAMRYGSVPIVRKVGGLNDTVENFDSIKKRGNGFVFNDFDEFAFYGIVVRAMEIFNNKPLWKIVQQNAMKSDYSWEFSAREYIKLYERSFMLKNKKNPQEIAIENLLS